MAPATHAPLTRAVIIGVTGRMGRSLLKEAPAFAQLIVTGAVASPDSLAIGRDAGELLSGAPLSLTISGDLKSALAQAQVALDFTHAEALAGTLAACRAARCALLVGTTGFGPELERQLDAASQEIALLVAPNTSVGVAVLTELTRRAAQALPPTFDIDVLEQHHRGKRDAPSGTALLLGRAAAGARGLPFVAPSAALSAPAAERESGEIRYASIRAGDVVGEHTVLFSGTGEQLSVRHLATDRAVFARGALAAALWLAGQPPGRYGMRDFLGFKNSHLEA
jgi:4-hydroxy-tetrahydrodipicolinate reductase